MKVALLFVLIMPLVCIAQTENSVESNLFNNGIQFVKAGWKDVLKKAKSENKYVFVDCYATWCMPCKKMEKEVFAKTEVGDFINANFISVRVQLDTSKADGEFVKSWYEDASRIKNQHKVNSFPSYLFLSPDGKIVHRYLFALSDTDFLKVAKAALVPEKQYYTMLERYMSGKIDLSKLGYLATVTKQIGEDSLAKKIAKDYLRSYLNKLNTETILQRKHYDFINTFSSLLSSKDKLFYVLYNEGDKVDEVMNQKGFAKSHVQSVIAREEINPKLWPTGKPITSMPIWDQLTASIHQKYNQYYTGLVVLDAQLKWYMQKKDTQQIIKHRIKYLDNYGLDTVGIGWVYINNFAWDYVFYHCNNKDTLNKVAGWMKQIIENHPEDHVSIDTYANLLYKAGRKDEAITWEGKAILLDKEASKREKREPDPAFQQTLDKMKKGIATWETK